MYADYTYYGGSFSGSLISEGEYPSIERQAECYIDAITFNRLHNGCEVTEAVQNAVCAVADVIKSTESSAKAAETAVALKSESNDGYSVSYENAQTIINSIDFLKHEAAAGYIMYTGLMDRSV